MLKKFLAVPLFAFLAFISFTSAKCYPQVISSAGQTSVSEQFLYSNFSLDNIVNPGSRCFVLIGSAANYQLYKHFLGDMNLVSVGSPFNMQGYPGAMFRNTSTGVIYVYNQASPYGIFSLDTTSGVWTQVLASCNGIPHSNLTGMVWDHTSGILYGLSTDLNNTAIFTINISTGTCSVIGPSSTVCTGGIGLYCAPNGSLFVTDIKGQKLCKVNKTTGAFTVVGPLGFGATYNQKGAFDLNDGTLYLTSEYPAPNLRICDTVTGSATVIIGSYTNLPKSFTIVGNPPCSILHMPLRDTLNLSGPYVINAVITPSEFSIKSAKIFWSRNNTTITDSSTMTNSSGNYWIGSILGNNSVAVYRYYIKALDSLGRTGYHPYGAPSSVNSFRALASDTTKPLIIHTPITEVFRDVWPAVVSAYVSDNIGIDSVWVRWYKNNNSVIKRFKLLPISGTKYAAVFNSLYSDVYIGDSIFYRIIAQDNSPNHNRDSSALYRFVIVPRTGSVYLGNGITPMGSSSGPYNTYWYGNRTQILYTANEILAAGGGYGNILKIGFQISEVGGQAMNGLTFRIKNTQLTSITTYESTGWTTVYSGNYTVPGTGWQYVDLTAPFFWDGNQNLLLEICFGNTSYSTATTVLGTAMFGMEISEYHDLSTACAYTGFTTPTPQTARANTSFFINSIWGTGTNSNGIPTNYSLSQNYPNPFNPVTRINFDVPKQGFVSIKIYDILGREVKTLVNEIKTSGKYSVDFEADELSSGVYFYRMEANGFMDIKRMVLIK